MCYYACNMQHHVFHPSLAPVQRPTHNFSPTPPLPSTKHSSAHSFHTHALQFNTPKSQSQQSSSLKNPSILSLHNYNNNTSTPLPPFVIIPNLLSASFYPVLSTTLARKTNLPCPARPHPSINGRDGTKTGSLDLIYTPPPPCNLRLKKSTPQSQPPDSPNARSRR